MWDFLAKEIVRHRATWDRAESVDTAIVPKLGEIGFLGMTIPNEFGVVGSSVTGVVSVSLRLVGNTILTFGIDKQKRKHLHGLTADTSIGAAGSPSRTRPRKAFGLPSGPTRWCRT